MISCHLYRLNAHIFELLPKNSFFWKIKVSILLINVTLKLNWSGHVKISSNMSNTVEKSWLAYFESTSGYPQNTTLLIYQIKSRIIYST